MAIIKCKMCGGDMELSPDKTFGTCEYCGSVMTLPKIDDEQRAAQFNRGNHFRRQGEFDKALAVYERIVAEDDTDAEAHWCCALCRFGIEYVEDPGTLEYLPTCHRASFDSFLEDVDYLAALEHSDGLTKRQYQKDGAKIAEVQRAILATSQKEEPFDVFICYKETDDETKERTRDSLDAQEIYYNLTQEGYRVFFARITLEDKAGTEYEPYIFAALNSARVMVVVGEKAEYFSAVWVKNEWSRFLSLMRKDRTKLLLPCYKNVDPYDLPEQLGVLQSYDMAKIGFMQDLIRGIKKVLQKDEPKELVKESVVVQQSAGGANINAQLKRGMQALEDKDWTAADGFFDKALDMDAECAEAFFGKALAAHRVSTGEALVQKRSATEPSDSAAEHLTACEKDEARIQAAVEKYRLPGYLEVSQIRDFFSYDQRTYPSMVNAWKERLAEEGPYWEGDRNLSRALRYSRGNFAATLRQYQAQIEDVLRQKLAESETAAKQAAEDTAKRYADAMTKGEKAAEGRWKSAEQRKESDYQELCRQQESGRTQADFSTLSTLFAESKWNGYKDCAERAEQCRTEAETIRLAAEKAAAAAKKKKTTICVIAAAAVVVIVAAALLTVKVIIPSSKYKSAETMLAAGDYDGAAAGFAALGDYKDSADMISESFYQKATALLAAKDYDGAAAGFAALGDYKDSADMITEAYYQKAESLLAALDYDGAETIFKSLGGYKESAVKIHTIIEAYYSKALELSAAGERFEADKYFYKCGDYRDARGRCSVFFSNRKAIVAGDYYTLGLKANGTVVSSGKNESGQCDVGSWTDIISVAAGTNHTVGLRVDGTVVAVGSNSNGKCDVGSWTDIISVAAGTNHTVGLRADGTVVAVGSSSYNQTDVGSWTGIVAIAAGSNTTVGLKGDGTLVAVGSNSSWLSQWTDIVDIAISNNHIVGLKADGTVVAGGDNSYNKCNVGKWTNIVVIAAAEEDTVGLESDGTVVAAGRTNSKWCDVSDWSDIVAVAAGCNFTVGLKSDGTVVATGDNKYGQCDVSGWTGIMLP